MEKVLKGYDVYFTLRSPACVLVGAYSEEEAREEAEKVLAEMSKAELIDRLLAAAEFDGLEIQYLEYVDTMED